MPHRRRAPFLASSAVLRPRETQVARLVIAGRTSKEIARRLEISPLTVRKHRENVMRKLDVHSMAELAAAARSLGIADTPSEVYPADAS